MTYSICFAISVILLHWKDNYASEAEQIKEKKQYFPEFKFLFFEVEKKLDFLSKVHYLEIFE